MIEMRLDINITGLEELAASILALAHGMPGSAVTEKQRGDTVQTKTEATQPAVLPTKVTAPAAPMPAPVTPTPVQAAPVHQPVATSAPSYTLNDLARAAAPLMDSGVGQIALQQLLASFGVVALPELPQERYAEFAAALREMGAQI